MVFTLHIPLPPLARFPMCTWQTPGQTSRASPGPSAEVIQRHVRVALGTRAQVLLAC